MDEEQKERIKSNYIWYNNAFNAVDRISNVSSYLHYVSLYEIEVILMLVENRKGPLFEEFKATLRKRKAELEWTKNDTLHST